ncbi:MAG: cation:dicarboxylase symporter family transporter [Megasphaera cerevisiae]|jgi:L-cystine uptake protein TcyP (sodium:dicarboxylate symporter family)|nr:cation:dicarboxylase symporter family transporter [Megasphaera cerevisiae]
MESVFLRQFLMISDMRTVLFLAVLIVLFGFIYYLYKKRHMSFSVVVMIGTGLGLLLGLSIQAMIGFSPEPMKITFVKEVTNWYALFGNGFMDLIKMLVVPLVLITMVHVVINMKGGQTMSKLVKAGVGVTMGMVAIAAVVGTAMGMLFQVGAGIAVESGAAKAKEIVSVASTLRSLIPGNLVDSMVHNNVIGMVIFAAILGAAIWWVNYEDAETAEPLYKLINSLYKAIINMALLILDLMPYAVIPLLANTIAQHGLVGLLDVGKFIIVLYAAMILQFIIQLIMLALYGINPWPHLKKSYPALLLAFTSRSSLGCLPMTLETLTKRLGVSQGTASFVAGFGCTAGMQGCAGVFPSMLIVYVANVTGQPIDFTLIVMTIIVVTIGSLGIAGIPGVATMAASVGLSGVGMGAQFVKVSPILAIDPFIDMGRTLLNVAGAITNALIVDKYMGSLNAHTYQDMQAGLQTKKTDTNNKQ